MCGASACDGRVRIDSIQLLDEQCCSCSCRRWFYTSASITKCSIFIWFSRFVFLLDAEFSDWISIVFYQSGILSLRHCVLLIWWRCGRSFIDRWQKHYIWNSVLIVLYLFFVWWSNWQYRRKDAGSGGGKKGDKKDLNELKQELDIDDHKIPIEELYQRLGTNPETVCVFFFKFSFDLYFLTQFQLPTFHSLSLSISLSALPKTPENSRGFSAREKTRWKHIS